MSAFSRESAEELERVFNNKAPGFAFMNSVGRETLGLCMERSCENALKLAVNATNISDVRTLVIHPSSTIYAHSSEAQKHSAGVFDDTIRISVGIEDINDLIEDFDQAIKSL